MNAQQWYEWILSNAKDYGDGRIPYGTFSIRSRHLHDAAAKDGKMVEVLRLLREELPSGPGSPIRVAALTANHERLARKSQSYSTPKSCVALDGCRLDGE